MKMLCSKCGYEINDDKEEQFCPNCGCELEKQAEDVKTKKKPRKVWKKLGCLVVGVFTLAVFVYTANPKTVVKDGVITVRPAIIHENNNSRWNLTNNPIVRLSFRGRDKIKKLRFQKV